MLNIYNGEGNGTPLQYSCLENPMDRAAWKAAVHGVAEGRAWLSWLHFQFSRSCIGEGNGNPLQCSCLWIPRTGEPGGLLSMGLHRVGHHWSNLACLILEKAVAPHSSTLAWKIPWMEEPGGPQSMGSLRVWHDSGTSLSRVGEGNGNPLQCSFWKIPGMGEPGGLLSVGSHRVRHD